MAKKFPKAKNKKVKQTADKKTREYLFKIIWAALEDLNILLTSNRAEKLTTEHLTRLAKMLTYMQAAVQEDIGAADNH